MARREISFREARAADAAAFGSFMRTVLAETDYLVMDESGFSFGLEDLKAILHQKEASPRDFVFLAFLDEEVVGAVTVASSTQQALAHIGTVFVAVKKAYWGQGIGRLLLEEVCVWAEEMGVLARLELTVQTRNERAVALYQQIGFAIEGVKPRGVRTSEGEWADLYYMGLLLGE